MRGTGKVAIARFVMRDKQYLATIRPIGELLGLETMFFADEIRGVDAVDHAALDADVDGRQLGIAEQLIGSMTTEWDASRYRDTYHERVLDLIERKARGEEVVVDTEHAETAEVVDLMEALRASVEQSQQRTSAGAAAMTTHGAAGLLEGLSRDELYERAADADVSGRSKMSKDELAAALQHKATS
ncbi:MAG: Ku protein [Egibacteraceae bacterium]